MIVCLPAGVGEAYPDGAGFGKNGQGSPAWSPRCGAEASWDARHRRVTFYCPEDVLEAIHDDMARSGRSKTRVVVDALREHLLHQ
jgi:hypothetical protein